MNTKPTKQNGFYSKYGKRMFDLCIALILFPFISVIIILTGIVILFIEKDKVFFKQIRIGKNGNPFLIWKFRTMNAVAVQTNTPVNNWTTGIPDDFIFKENLEDPRITKLGRWLRQLSIDELPQYFNVIKGDMSFIGPRPEVPYFTEQYNDYQNRRLEVKPGITGWAQVNGRSNITHGQKIDFDREYVQKYDLSMDLEILAKTVVNLVKREGAY